MNLFKFDDRNCPKDISVDVSLTSAQLLAMHATPVQVLPALPAGQAYIILGASLVKPAGTAYAAIDVADDILLKYTDASGATLLHVETTGFMDQATKQVRYAYPSVLSTNLAAGIFAVTPVESAAVVAYVNNTEMTTGNTTLNLRIYARIVPTDLASEA